MKHQNILIKNGQIIDPVNAINQVGDLCISRGKIHAVGTTPSDFVPEITLDANDQIVCPGFVDLSAYLGNIESELQAAVAGGVTSLACPPNISPVLDEPGLIERLVRKSEAQALCRVFPVGALTQKLAGEKLAEMNSMAQAGCIAFSQTYHPLFNTQLLMRAMQYAVTFHYPIIFYPQDYYLSHEGVAHNGEVASRLGLPAIPVSAETIAIASALSLAKETGVRLHFANISSAEGIALIEQAKKQGMNISADTTIHHLHLSESDIGFFDSRARLEPPLRSEADRAALRQAAKDGLIAICSDHKPVNEDEKQLPFGEATPGATALELLLPLTLKWAEEEKIDLMQALARISCDPARILGIPAGSLGVGQAADICIFDPKHSWEIKPESLKSKGKNSPFIGKTLQGQVRTTLVSGNIVYQAQV